MARKDRTTQKDRRIWNNRIPSVVEMIKAIRRDDQINIKKASVFRTGFLYGWYDIGLYFTWLPGFTSFNSVVTLRSPS